jgi:predicted enzyme related to lactoylglutathione lyase
MITSVKFVSVPVRDQDAALAFYTEKLGFRVLTDQPMGEEMGGQRWIELEIGRSTTRFVLFTAEGDEKRIGSFMNMSLECDDLAATYRELVEKGVEFVQPPQRQDWGEYAIFKDSEGNQFVMSSR